MPRRSGAFPGSVLLLFMALSLAVSLPAPTALAANADAQKTRELVALLQSDAELHVRARACQQLAILGTGDAVPALAALLAHEKLGHYARDALQVMPDGRAGDALRNALGRLKGNLLVGVVSSVGLRRDAQAVPDLTRLAADPRSGAAPAALLALGRIGGPEAARVLQQTLISASAELRPAAAEGCLLVAEQNLKQGRRDAAIALYDAVREAAPEGQLRVTATHGAILARGAGGLPLLVEHMHSADTAMRDIALRSVRELPGPQITPAVVAELRNASPALQALIIAALTDRGERSALAPIEAKATAADEPVRLAAIEALGRIGARSSIPILLRAITSGGGEPESDAAVASLARVSAPETDAAILKALAAAEPAVRVKLIGVLGDRKAESAIGELIALAQDSNREIRAAAFRALMLVARPSDLPDLVRLSITADDDGIRTLADRALVTTSMKVLEPERRADAVLAAFRNEPDPNVKAALLRPLGAVVRSMAATFDAFVAVKAALSDASPELRAAAIRCLAAWPDATPSTTLLDLVSRGLEPGSREVALSGAIRMATNVAAGRDRSPLDPVAFFTQANRIVRTPEEKMMIVSGLGNVKHIAAFEMLQPYLDDSSVRTEAALAVVQIAPGLLNTKQAGAVKAVLAKIAAAEEDEDTRKKAARAAKGLPVQPAGKQKRGGGAAVAAGNRAPPKLPPGALFNGSDFSGWEGDPGVWRIRDGAIVGGTLEGNPRNEFLATAKRYRNFVLRLEYKLVGTAGFVNGGVQFRSVRVDEPANEMSGYQADIGAGHSGSLYDESRRKKFLARAAADQIARLEQPGQWNRYEIRCEGPRVELSLNGEKTLTFTETDPSVKPDGVIALQIHGNCKAEIAFRNIAIEELP